jgi:hypothetical protein
VKIKGFDKFQKELKRLQKTAKKLDGTLSVPLTDLFTASFMRRYTQFDSFEDFLASGGFVVNSQEDFEAIPDKDMDAHVAKTTRFATWEEMFSKAAELYFAKKLGF